MKGIINGKIITEGNNGRFDILERHVLLFDKKIIQIVPSNYFAASQVEELIDAEGLYVSPGFINTHVHGCGGADTMDDDPNALITMAMQQARNGVTSFLATTMTYDMPRIYEALERIRKHMETENPKSIGAKVIGCHMEGPFISEKYKGAQDKKNIQKADFSAAVLWAKLMNKPVTLAITAKMEIFKRDTWRNKILSLCDNYIATSKEIGIGYSEQGGIDKNKVTVLPHGLDSNKYPALSLEDKEIARQKHGIDKNAMVVVFCARIVADKGIATVVKSWPIVHKAHPNARLFVVGGGKQDLLDELKNMAKATDNSAVIVGEVDYPQEYYQLGDIYLFPSRHEALPTSLIEAMSSGLTPITCRIGGCEDVVIDNETGFMEPVDDYEAFANRMIYLMDNPAECKRLSENAHNLVYDYCDYSNVIWKLEEIMKS